MAEGESKGGKKSEKSQGRGKQFGDTFLPSDPFPLGKEWLHLLLKKVPKQFAYQKKNNVFTFQ